MNDLTVGDLVIYHCSASGIPSAFIYRVADRHEPVKSHRKRRLAKGGTIYYDKAGNRLTMKEMTGYLTIKSVFVIPSIGGDDWRASWYSRQVDFNEIERGLLRKLTVLELGTLHLNLSNAIQDMARDQGWRLDGPPVALEKTPDP